MTSLVLLLPLLFPAADLPKDVINVSARIEADSLNVGEEYDVLIDVKMKDGWSASASGLPSAILQIKVPRSVKLAGKVLETQRELAKNEYLRMPFERLIKENPTRVKFKLLRKPKKKDRLRFNVLAYVHSPDGNDDGFVRRRFKLKVKPGAEATSISAKHSSWGRGKELQLGDKAVPFKLQRADGSTASLKSYLGKKNVVVTTYRAFW